VGSAVIEEVVRGSKSFWAVRGNHHWVLGRARRCTPRKRKGQLGFFKRADETKPFHIHSDGSVNVLLLGPPKRARLNSIPCGGMQGSGQSGGVFWPRRLWAARQDPISECADPNPVSGAARSILSLGRAGEGV
jgi:hypothetical protein